MQIRTHLVQLFKHIDLRDGAMRDVNEFATSLIKGTDFH